MQPDSPLSDDVLHQTLDAAPDGVVVVDPAGTILFVNPMVETLFGYDRDELLGTSVDMLLPENVRSLHAGRRADYGARPRTRSMGSGLDLHGRRRSGDEFPLEISLSPLHTPDGLLVVAIVRDVTERRAADQELQRAREALALVEDRERIARDLHDTVIQRLFAVGLSLQGAITRAAADPAVERIQMAIDDIDVTIRDVRAAIFALHTRRAFGESVRDDLLTVTREAARVLGFEPQIAFDGPVDSVATDQVREHVVATLREALSNITRHAHASAVTITLVVEGRDLVLRVDDDGRGISETGAGRGLSNMRDRATEIGGTCAVTSSPETGGTRIEWRVPIGDEPT
jgi:PAS domain S-box-containing protein